MSLTTVQPGAAGRAAVRSLPARVGLWCVATALLLGAGGCATVPPGAGNNPQDPYERVNRQVYVFNDFFDRDVAQPVARGYLAVVPQPIRNCIGNFFANVGEIGNFINASLQFKPGDAGRDAGRFLVNTTAGVLGCFDVARAIGWERNRQDFGLTFGDWGIASGPYLVLPFLGPSDLRDAVGEIPDYFDDPIRFINPTTDYYLIYGTRFVDRRSQFLDTSSLVDDAALDPYAFLRDAYLQRRRSRIDDGSPPPSNIEDPDSLPAPAAAPAVPAPAPKPGTVPH